MQESIASEAVRMIRACKFFPNSRTISNGEDHEEQLAELKQLRKP